MVDLEGFLEEAEIDIRRALLYSRISFVDVLHTGAVEGTRGKACLFLTGVAGMRAVGLDGMYDA